jgi:hypothetical protein
MTRYPETEIGRGEPEVLVLYRKRSGRSMIRVRGMPGPECF